MLGCEVEKMAEKTAVGESNDWERVNSRRGDRKQIRESVKDL